MHTALQHERSGNESECRRMAAAMVFLVHPLGVEANWWNLLAEARLVCRQGIRKIRRSPCRGRVNKWRPARIRPRSHRDSTDAMQFARVVSADMRYGRARHPTVPPYHND